jgi:hypothetical protein
MLNVQDGRRREGQKIEAGDGLPSTARQKQSSSNQQQGDNARHCTCKRRK